MPKPLEINTLRAAGSGPGSATQEARGSQSVLGPKAARPLKKSWTAAEKLRIVTHADSCSGPGEVAALLRREGIYSSHLWRWRKQFRASGVRGLESGRAGRPAKRTSEQKRILELEKQTERLKRELEMMRGLVELQKKVQQMFGIALPEVTGHLEERS